ncbi:uncharacterized protein FIBRA_07236 [Fibroporia radiculosa]|uniref:Lipoyl-binding domain-containing protein n=1 Tax=Fibroporia radiculosa TaxID=599839 RepID=J4H4I1_9APHY|nr:uncharacterized protein FIBRA_07236 [Fibroporia radiculosa]CCM05034.1 predicted protein [Fibroporia radiculosa]
MHALRHLSRSAPRSLASRRCMQTTAARMAVTNFQMPAMSPTMTEGGIADWKKKEGDSFAAGDVLLEIETDKATIDVEAQDDGILGKILVPNGAKGIRVGHTIALLAEEGDDISNLEPPAESTPPPRQDSTPAASSSTPPSSVPDKQQPQQSAPPAQPSAHPQSSRPLFPSVLRLLQENAIVDAGKITGTGVRGMLTKGDVLAFLGKASGPFGTYNPTASANEPSTSAPKKPEPAPLDGPALRRLIVGNMLEASLKARTAAATAPPADFDSVIADYLPPAKTSAPSSSVPQSLQQAKSNTGFLDGLI